MSCPFWENEARHQRSVAEHASFFLKHWRDWAHPTETRFQFQINDPACRAVAGILHELRAGPNGASLFCMTTDTGGLGPRELAQIRFFTAPQDFRGSIDMEKVINAHRDDPDRFKPEVILADAEGFLKVIMPAAEANKQHDKRVQYAQTCAGLLVGLECDVFDLAARFDGSAARLRRFLSEENTGTGFGPKKCDMFLRDMLVWKVWELRDVECIDVASDANTMRVALRTRILTTAIPLLSSFLDVFCYQYGLIDQWNALAWRRVWELWRETHPDTCPECPAMLDYFIYRIIGKEFCRDGGLTVLQCDRDPEHTVYWHNARKKVCPLCEGGGRGRLVLVSRHLPCTHDKGDVRIRQSSYVTGNRALLPNITECPFVPVCNPRSADFRARIAPDSISIEGGTGWRTAYTTREQAGGGLSS